MTAAGAPRVLLVDDDQSLTRMVRLTFLIEGFEVYTASNGLEGLELLQEVDPDLIVLDLQMPKMDGRAFYRELRARGVPTPVVILSAYGAEEAMRELRAEACVPKPFDPSELIHKARDIIHEHGPASSDGHKS